jgi:hypothetical protein
VNGTFDLGAHALTGTGNVNTTAAAVLGIGSPDGIDTGTMIGNIRVTGSRTFAPSTAFIYNGSVNQNTGNGLPPTVAHLTIANTGNEGSNTVAGNMAQAVTGLLNVHSGVYASTGSYNNVQIDPGSVFSAPSSITVSGDWTNNGMFNANQSGVTFNGSGTQTLRGNTTFYDLARSASSQTLSFEADKTQTVTHSLTLNGTAGQPLLLRSTVTDTRWRFNVSPMHALTYVDVRDSDASTGNAISAINSIDSGNNMNWTFTNTIGITGVVSYAVVVKPVANAVLNASGSIHVSGTTGLTGSYSLAGFGTGAYTVTPSKAAQPCGTANGIFANDAALIARHIVGLITLSPTQLAAAKVSGDITPAVSSFDASLISQKVVGICSASNSAGQWRFSPISVKYPSGVTTNHTQNYTAYMLGDVSGDWDPIGPTRPSSTPQATR